MPTILFPIVTWLSGDDAVEQIARSALDQRDAGDIRPSPCEEYLIGRVCWVIASFRPPRLSRSTLGTLMTRFTLYERRITLEACAVRKRRDQLPVKAFVRVPVPQLHEMGDEAGRVVPGGTGAASPATLNFPFLDFSERFRYGLYLFGCFVASLIGLGWLMHFGHG